MFENQISMLVNNLSQYFISESNKVRRSPLFVGDSLVDWKSATVTCLWNHESGHNCSTNDVIITGDWCHPTRPRLVLPTPSRPTVVAAWLGCQAWWPCGCAAWWRVWLGSPAALATWPSTGWSSAPSGPRTSSPSSIHSGDPQHSGPEQLVRHLRCRAQRSQWWHNRRIKGSIDKLSR